MSNLGVLLSLMAILGMDTAVCVYGATRTQEWGTLIATGVSPCGPVSMRWRWLTLFNNLLAAFTFLAVFVALSALGSVEVGRAVTDDRVRMLANLIAAFGAFASLFLLLHGGSVVVMLASDLRKASQPPTNPK